MPNPFDEFLSWLSPDREEAGGKYKCLLKNLIHFFNRSGCHIPEELADDTIERAGRNVAAGKVERSVDPGRYCYGIARHRLQEYWREIKPEPLPPDPIAIPVPDPDPVLNEQKLGCMRKCLNAQDKETRDLLTRWHLYKGSEKIRVHKEMGEAAGGMNKLRIRICRIKKTVHDCYSDCMKRNDRNLLQ